MVPIVPLEELVGNCGISMASGSGGATLPSPGAFVTPQAGQLGETSITRFFDPSTYRGKTMGLPPLGPRETMHELTQENINRFFDQTTYHGKMVELPPMGPSLVMPGLKKHDVQHLMLQPTVGRSDRVKLHRNTRLLKLVWGRLNFWRSLNKLLH